MGDGVYTADELLAVLLELLRKWFGIGKVCMTT